MYVEEIDQKFIKKHYHDLKFKHKLSVELIDNDEDLFKFLIEQLNDLEKIYDLQDKIEQLKDESAHCSDLEDEVDKLEDEKSDLMKEVESLHCKIFDLNETIGKLTDKD